jgi:N-acetylmuramoyl-L-alanine amidase
MICVHAGHGGADPGAIGNGYKEADLTIDLRNRISTYLVNNTAGVAIHRDNDDHTLLEVIRQHNNLADEKSVNLEIHFNASDKPTATGVECFKPDRHTEEESEFARKIVTISSSVLKLRSRGVKTAKESNRGKLYIEKMDGCNILLEVCFISNKEDLNAYLLRRDKLAEEIGLILIEAYERLKKM